MKPCQERESLSLQMYGNNVVRTSGENLSTMSFYEMFVMISYFTFVYHILIYHFFYLPGFLKKKTIYYFLKKQSYFYTKLSFQVTKKQISGIAEHAVFPVGGSRYDKRMEDTDQRCLCHPCTPARACAPAGQCVPSKAGQMSFTRRWEGNKSFVEFCSHEIILLLSKVLKEPKFRISECTKGSRSSVRKSRRIIS